MNLFGYFSRLLGLAGTSSGRDGGSASDAESGSVAIQIAVAGVVLIGMIALGVEGSFLLLQHRHMQAAADAAAIAGADALAAGNTGGVVNEALAVAAQDGFSTGVDEVVVTVNNPPVDGTYAGDTGAVQVIVSQPQHLTLIRVLTTGEAPVSARAVAKVQGSGRYCLFALDPSASPGLLIWNNAVLTNPNCGVAVNSSSTSALTLYNNAGVYGPVNVHGGAALSNGAVLSNPSVILHGSAVPDPYAGVAIQTPPACTGQSGSGGGTKNLTPGHFCSGWNFSNNATLNLSPGVYYLDTRLTLGNGVTVNGMGGVTIVINGAYAISLGNNDVLNLTAPVSGNYAGIAFFGPRNSTPSVVQYFNNNSVLNVTGVVYFPSQKVTFTNNGHIGTTQCTQVVAMIIEADNNLQLDNNCTGTGVQPIGSTAKLVQ